MGARVCRQVFKQGILIHTVSGITLAAGNPLGCQSLYKLINGCAQFLFYPEHIEPVRGLVTFPYQRRSYALDFIEGSGNSVTVLPSLFTDPFDSLQLSQADGAGQFVHTVVGSNVGNVTIGTALCQTHIVLVGKAERFLVKGKVIHDTQTAVACRDVFVVIQTEAADITKSACQFALIVGHVCLSTILNNLDIVLFGNRHNLIHICRVTCQMNHQNCLGFVCNLCLNRHGVHVVGVGVNIGKNRDSVLVQNTDDTSHIGNWRGNNLIALGHANGAESRMNCRGAGGGCHTVSGTVHLCKSLIQGFYLIAVPVEQSVLVESLF